MTRKDFTQVALDVVRQATGEAPKHVPAQKQETKRKAGLIGGKARAAKLTPEERAEIAKKAANARRQRSPTEPAAGEPQAVPTKKKVRV